MHPILRHKTSQLYFIMAWILITAIHVLVLNFFYRTETRYALIDGITFNTIMAVIAIGIWYPVKFMQSADSRKMGLVLNHLGVGVLTISLWLTAGYFIIEIILGEDNAYIAFLDQSMPWRVVSGVLQYLVILLIY